VEEPKRPAFPLNLDIITIVTSWLSSADGKRRRPSKSADAVSPAVCQLRCLDVRIRAEQLACPFDSGHERVYVRHVVVDVE
jgi:hypothetical protein